MRLTSLTAAALMGAALLVPMGTATAAGETCQGQPATIVGSPGGTITGTEGADVIVTNGATRVDALGGDDRVCATGGGGVVAILGAGADTFTDENGGSHQVVAGTLDGTDMEADVIRLSKFGRVTSGMAGHPNADTIDLAETGYVHWNGVQTAPGAVTVGKGGGLILRPAHAVKVDAGGTVTGSDTSLRWTGHFDEFDYATTAEEGTFTFRGTDGIEHLTVDAPATFDRNVKLGGGDDTYRTNGLGRKASIIRGNAGEDRLEVDLATRRLKADLGRRIIDTQDGSKTLIRSFDDYSVVAKTAKIRGTNRGERIEIVTCKAWVNAGPSKDLIIANIEFGDGDEMGTPRCGKYRAVVNGGRGHDTIKGSPGNDRLRGNRGRDATDGRAGRDACEGERRVRCERRL
jgi:Ca2+-binding RTX toxin-like protein